MQVPWAPVLPFFASSSVNDINLVLAVSMAMNSVSILHFSTIPNFCSTREYGIGKFITWYISNVLPLSNNRANTDNNFLSSNKETQPKAL